MAKHSFTIFAFVLSFLFFSCKAHTASVVESTEILEDLKNGKSLYYKDKTIKGELDLTTLSKYQISSNVSKVDIIGAVTFENCNFEESFIAYKSDKDGKVILVEFSKCLSFSSCIFQKSLVLREIIVKGLFNLTKSQIQEETSFEGAQLFNQISFFSDTKFKGQARFQRIKFWGNVDFLRAEFWENTSFQLADFDGNVLFGDAIFNKNVDFGLALFNKKLILNNSLFYGFVDFSSASFKGRTEIIKAQFKSDAIFDEIKCWDVFKLNTSSFASKLSFVKAVFFFAKPELKSVVFEKDKILDITDAILFEKKPLILE